MTVPGEYDAVWELLGRLVDACHAAAALALARLHDGDAVVRATACDLLGVLSDRHDDVQGDAATALIALAATETDGDVQWSIARALGHTFDTRAGMTLIGLSGHADPDVRLQAAMSMPPALTGDDDDPVVAALIRLSADDDPDVRNWATFGLGWCSDTDTDDVRRALWQRTTDTYSEAREEGIRGLARRRVPGALPLLAGLLANDAVHVFTLEAAGILGDPSLVPLLEEFGPDDPQAVGALEACRRGAA